MKTRLTLSLAALALCIAANSQEIGTPVFRDIRTLTVTSVKDQYESGTCWDYATTALLEAEAIRINGIKDPGKSPDFSEMYTVYRSYQDRLVKYIRVGGHLTHGPGSLSPDLLHVVKDYGIVPQSAMPGLKERPELRNLDREVLEFMKEMVSSDSLLRTVDWKGDFVKLLEKHLGPCPETFTVNGKEYTAASYRDSFGINPDDYITIGSFTHVPFYREFITDVPDNWRWDSAWNVPLDELLEICHYALEHGYTFAWDADMSEDTWLDSGLAYMPESELPVTQESRQKAYDLKYTVDDHLMLIYGTAQDKQNHKYFVVKNSWGTGAGNYKGDWYVTEEYFAAKTIQITLHKDAVPQHISAKLIK